MKSFQRMQETKVDVATMFFSSTFFFESEETLDGLIRTLELGVRKGGFVVGTGMDGQAMCEFLRDVDAQQLKTMEGAYHIRKLYSGENSNIFGQAIEIHLPNTIVRGQIEYLAWFDLFCARMKARGFDLIESQMFEPPRSLQLVDFSRLFRSFVFRKSF